MKILKNRKKLFKPLLVIILSASLVGAGLFWYLQGKDINRVTSDPGFSDDVNLEPATEQDQQQADQKKQDIVDQEDQNPAVDSKKSVTPVITIAAQFNDAQYGNRVEIRAFIPSIYEDTGKCTANFTKGNTSFTRQVEALKDATTTRCDTVQVAREDFPSSGSWSVRVNYSSLTAQGSSEARTFSVE